MLVISFSNRFIYIYENLEEFDSVTYLQSPPGPLLLSECTHDQVPASALSLAASFASTSSAFLDAAFPAQISQKATALKTEISE